MDEDWNPELYLKFIWIQDHEGGYKKRKTFFWI